MHNDGMVLDMAVILVMSVGASDVCHGAACDSQCAALQQLEQADMQLLEALLSGPRIQCRVLDERSL